jgi:hypothetical protein
MTFEFSSLKLVLRRYTHSKKHLQVEQVPLRFILSRDISFLIVSSLGTKVHSSLTPGSGRGAQGPGGVNFNFLYELFFSRFHHISI